MDALTERGWTSVPPAPGDLVSGLFRTHYRRLVGLAALLVGDHETTRDVVQDAFAGLCRGWGTLRNPDAAVAYLNRAVVNGSRNELRRSRLAVGRQFRLMPVSDALDSAETAAVAHDDEARLRRALGQLSPRQRQVLVLRYYLDQTEAEIADTLGMSRGSPEQSRWGSNVLGDDPDTDDSDHPNGREFHCLSPRTTSPASEGADLELIDVRVGGIVPASGELGIPTDRVVFEFTGVGTPGWDLGYVRDMSSTNGDPLQLATTGVTGLWSEETLYGETLPNGPTKPSGERGESIIREVQVGSGSTGYDGSVRSRIFTGSSLPGGSEFCVNLLQDPTRLVISFPYAG